MLGCTLPPAVAPTPSRKQYTGNDIAKYAQLNSNVEVNLIIDAISAIRFTCREIPHAGFDLPKFMLPPKQILSPKKPTRWPSNLYRLVFGGYLYISLRTLAPYNSVCHHTKSTGIMMQIISDTPSIMFLTWVTICAINTLLSKIVSYVKDNATLMMLKKVWDDAWRIAPSAAIWSAYAKFPFWWEKRTKNRRKRVHDIHDWKHLKFYYTQVYNNLEKIINMKKTCDRKVWSEWSVVWGKSPSGPFPRHTT